MQLELRKRKTDAHFPQKGHSNLSDHSGFQRLALFQTQKLNLASMNRRQFLQLSALAPAGFAHFPLALDQEAATLTLRLRIRPDQLGNQINADFTGLSYESAQLGDPGFFSGQNVDLAGFVRRLGRTGVLRIGGNTSEYCYWTPDADDTEAGRTAVGVPLEGPNQSEPSGAINPDTGLKVPRSVRIRPLAIRNLRDFLDLTEWKLIYGLNMGTGSREDAVAEAAYVMDVIGPKLIAFQLCNEPDLFYRNGIRKSDYGFAQFAEEWSQFFQAIREKKPSAAFAGPDTAYNNEWLVPFARQFKNDVQFISHHYYAEGPPTDPSMTIERLLGPDPKLQGEFEGMKAVQSETGLPFRLAETNSCFSGGKSGVSDTFASALWGGDLMFRLASQGGTGINFHGGGYGWYTPIAGTRENGFLARPIYYGMLLFEQAGSGQLVECKWETADQPQLVSAYALRAADGSLKAVIFNKSLDRRVQINLDPGRRVQSARAICLVAPRADDTTDVTLGGAPVGASGSWSAIHEERLAIKDGLPQIDLPAASAALISFAHT
jgi:hypothetical protein